MRNKYGLAIKKTHAGAFEQKHRFIKMYGQCFVIHVYIYDSSKGLWPSLWRTSRMYDIWLFSDKKCQPVCFAASNPGIDCGADFSQREWFLKVGRAFRLKERVG